MQTHNDFLALYYRVLRELNHPIRSLNYDYDNSKPLHLPSVLEFVRTLDEIKHDILRLAEYREYVEGLNAELNR